VCQRLADTNKNPGILSESGIVALEPVLSRAYLKKLILVQNDAKLMPNVVQSGREYQTEGIHQVLRG
jgi:hypothetical protein